jgi:predicted component of type VI protein secretion system
LAPFGQTVSEEKIFLTLANQKQELPLAAKLHVFGNNSKTVNNIRNLTEVKMISTARSNYPEILKKI